MDPTHCLWQYFMLICVIALQAKEKDQSVKWGALSGHPVQFPDLTLLKPSQSLKVGIPGTHKQIVSTVFVSL